MNKVFSYLWMFVVVTCLWACGNVSGTPASGGNLCLHQERFIFGGSAPTPDADSSCGSEGGNSESDGDSIAELPAIPTPRSNFFLGCSVLSVEEIDDFKTTVATPEAVHLRLTSANNFASLDNRSLITSLLSKAEELQTTPIITLATLFNKTYTTTAALNYRLASTINIEYFFSQLTTLLNTSDDSKENVVILLEPHLVDSVIASYGMTVSPTAIPVPTHLVYDLGYLDRAKDPSFADNLTGFIAATNYLIMTTRSEKQLVAWQLTIESAATGSNLVAGFRGKSGTTLSTAIRDTAKTYAALMTAMGFKSYGLRLAGFALNGDASWNCDTAASIAVCNDALNVNDWQNLTDFFWELHNESDFYFLLTNVSFSRLDTQLSQDEPYDFAGTYLFGGEYALSDAYFDGYTEATTTRSSNIQSSASHFKDLYNSFVIGVVFGDFDARDVDYNNDGGWWLDQLKKFDGSQYPIE